VPTMKRCPKCEVIKPATLEFFYTGKKWRDGFKPYCKLCQITMAVRWNKANPEKTEQARKNWRFANPTFQRQYAIQWRKDNIERARELDRVKQSRRRQKSLFRLNCRIRHQIYKCLSGGKGGKHWETIVGYNLGNLRRHIERQFEKNMNWENMGSWHIDHIIPVASFSFKDEHDPEFKACWALTNLAPRWAIDNLKKGSKRLYLL